VRHCLEPVGFGKKWIYRAGNQSVGMPVEEFRSACEHADLLIVRGSPIDLWRKEYDWPRRRTYIDSDPGFTQISLVNSHPSLTHTVEQCERLFTIGYGIGDPNCPIPTAGREWLKIVPPIFLPHWPFAEKENSTHFTSIMQWRSYPKGFHKGVTYGEKEKEFPKFMDLPKFTEQRFRLALIKGDPDKLASHGWEVVTGHKATLTPELYRRFIQDSRAEFGVAKHGYVQTHSGWFSDRSVCYLASGRPVLAQDTGQGDWLQIGNGFLAFRDLPEALKGIEAINSDYKRHCRGARLLAEQHFAAEKVMRLFLENAMA
jgi:hypothetical protein